MYLHFHAQVKLWEKCMTALTLNRREGKTFTGRNRKTRHTTSEWMSKREREKFKKKRYNFFSSSISFAHLLTLTTFTDSFSMPETTLALHDALWLPACYFPALSLSLLLTILFLLLPISFWFTLVRLWCVVARQGQKPTPLLVTLFASLSSIWWTFSFLTCTKLFDRRENGKWTAAVSGFFFHVQFVLFFEMLKDLKSSSKKRPKKSTTFM